MLLTLHTIKSLPKGQIAHNIIPEIRAPIAHILWWSPVTWLGGTLPNMLTPSAYIFCDDELGGLEGAVRERMIENAAPECVFVAIDLAVSAEGSGRSVDGAVPVGFLGVGFAGAVDFS
jgi:hypothetical protein